MLTSHSSTNLPITTTAGILNLDHYKYLRSLLPQVPHVIQSLVFTDLNNWECELFVNLLNESDSLKWLADFEEKTTTLWKADKDATTAVSHYDSSRRCHWIMIYRCVPTECKKDCTAKLEMKISSQDDLDRGNKHQKYPCQVLINFYHNHVTTENTVISMESFKSQDIPSHLKEGFEGYFQENIQPVGAGLNSLTNSVNLSVIKPQQTILSSPLTHSIHQVVTLKPEDFNVKAEPQYIKTESGPLSPVGQHLDGKLIDLNEISEKLEQTIDALRSMLKQNASSCAAVKQFVDKFNKLKNDQTQLEDALTSFGGQWDWLVAPQETIQTAQPQEESVPDEVPLTPAPEIHPSGKKKAKKKKKGEEDEFVLSNVSQLSVEGPESKRRKRARCGNCAGCLNRDKTQDCRQCRNCLDQKRYGGPGRLKKACIKRQCVVLSQLGSTDLPEKSGGSTTLLSSSNLLQSQPNQTLSLAINQSNNLPIAVKSEPQTQLLSSTSLQVPISSCSIASSSSISSIPASTLISWPGGQYPPTFQVQVQQPFQFSFTPQTTLQSQSGSLQQLQYTNSLPANTLHHLTNSLPGTLQHLTNSLQPTTLQQLTNSLQPTTLQQLTNSLQQNTLQQLTTSQGTILTTAGQLNQAQLDSLASEAARHHGVV